MVEPTTRTLSPKTLERIAAGARAAGWPEVELVKIGALIRALPREKGRAR